MLGVYGEHGEGIKSRELFKLMLQNGMKPNAITFVYLFNAYAHSGLVDDALHVLDSMASKFNT